MKVKKGKRFFPASVRRRGGGGASGHRCVRTVEVGVKG